MTTASLGAVIGRDFREYPRVPDQENDAGRGGHEVQSQASASQQARERGQETTTEAQRPEVEGEGSASITGCSQVVGISDARKVNTDSEGCAGEKAAHGKTQYRDHQPEDLQDHEARDGAPISKSQEGAYLGEQSAMPGPQVVVRARDAGALNERQESHQHRRELAQ